MQRRRRGEKQAKITIEFENWNQIQRESGETKGGEEGTHSRETQYYRLAETRRRTAKS